MSTVPYEKLHRKWAQLDKGNITNLQGSQLRMLAAFVYKHEIVVTTTSQSLFGQPVYCRYFDCHRRELNGTAWKSLMFPISVAFCARRAGAMFMSLSETPDGNFHGEPVPLVKRIAENYTHEISACVGPIYGNESRWLEIAETTEHHLIIGVTHFYFTIFDRMNEYSRKLVDEYERLGYFEVTTIQNEYEAVDWMSHMLQINVTSSRSNRFVNRTIFQDCHFRSRYHSKWILNVDIDERLVISVDSNVGEILITATRLVRDERLPEKYIGREHLLKELEYLKYHKTIKPMWDVPKILFRPEKVQALFYHWSYAQNPGVKVQALSVKDAYIRHYRTIFMSLLGHWHLDKKFKMTGMDPILEQKVTEAVTSRLESVYNQRKIRCEEIRDGLLGHFSKDNYNCTYSNGTRYVDVAPGN
uniref:Glycosyltransferase family 92 protein n=1 Tax=Caenorhabditis japonica TaxID=281687 RepID=A0A8R1HSX4_CAEJA